METHKYNELDYNEFEELISRNNNRTGRTITIGNVKFNGGLIYDPNENNGQGFSFTGEDANKETVDYLYKKAIDADGYIEYGTQGFRVI